MGTVFERLQAGAMVIGDRCATGAIVASLLLSACAAHHGSPQNPQAPAVQSSGTVAPEQPAVPVPAPPSPASAPTTASPTRASPGTSSSRPVAKPNDSAGAAVPKRATRAPAPVAKPLPPESSKAPTLDLGSLEQRLKDTKAIGVFTKLSLKNQVDDLLGQLRAFHSGSSKTPQTQLRQKFDTLIIKVLTLLQDGDPQLASAIASSREALWGILMDPKKFSQIG